MSGWRTHFGVPARIAIALGFALVTTLAITVDYETFNAIVLGGFIVILAAGFIRTWIRALQYRRDRRPIPALLWRDLFSRGGLALPFAMILLVRAAGWGPIVTGQMWWTFVTAVPALISVSVYAWYEFVIIDRPAAHDLHNRRSTD